MTGKFTMAKRAIKSMMSKVHREGTQHSKIWGSGQNRRSVSIWHNDLEYAIAMNCHGLPEKTETGDYDKIYNLAVSFLAEAG